MIKKGLLLISLIGMISSFNVNWEDLVIDSDSDVAASAAPSKNYYKIKVNSC